MGQAASVPAGTSQHSQSRLTVRLPPDLHREVKVAAAVAGETVAELVVRAIRRELGEGR